MKYIYLGKIVNTHGIKGEIRILSNFDKKELVFQKDFKVYIGNKKEEYQINSYRVHKNYDMITLKGINDINEVLKYKGSNIYINRDDLNLNENEYLLDDLLNMSIMENNINYGTIIDIYDNNGNILLKVKKDQEYYIPYHSKYLKKVDLKNKIVYTENIKELIL